MGDLYGICPSYITKVIFVRPLIEYDCKMYGRAEISQYEILFVVTKYTRISNNIILKYTKKTHIISCIQYIYKDKMIIIHEVIVT